MALGLRTIRVRLLGDSKGLDRAADRGQKQLSKWQRGFRRFGRAAGVGLAVAGAAAVKLGKDAVAAASDLNETVNKSNTIFGSNAKAMQKWAAGAAKNMGLSKQAALEAAASFGDMFQQIGFAGDQSAKMSRSVVQLSADLGSFNNLPTADVSERIAAAFRGEFDSLQALIPNINAARVEKVALAQSGKENADALTAQEKAQAVLNIVQKDGARAAGDFKRTSGDLANQQKILAAQLENVKARIGTALLPIMTKLANFATDTLVPGLDKLTNWAKNNPTQLKVAAGIIGGVLVVAFTAWAVSAAAAAAATIAATAPILAIIAAVAVVAAEIFLLVKNWDKVWKATKRITKRILDWVTKVFLGIFKAVRDALRSVWNHVRRTWNLIWSTTIAFLRRLTAGYVDAWRRVVDTVRRRIDQVVSFVRSIPGRVRRALANAGEVLLRRGRQLINGLLQGVRNAMDGIKDWLKRNVWDPIVNAVKSLFGISSPSTVFMDFGRQMILGLIKGMIRTDPSRLVRRALGGVTGVLGNLLDTLFPGGGGAPSTNMQLGRAMAAAMGWTGGQWTALRALWMGESGWNHRAENPTSGAYGIPQSLPASKMASAGADWRTNPATQIKWGLGYIRGRYGTPAAAYQAWLSRSPHWYDAGGVATGRGFIAKGTSEPERVLSPRQTAAFERLVDILGDGTTMRPLVGEVHLNHVPGFTTPQDLARGLRRAELSTRYHRRR